jgi:hypothetical protein
MYRDSSQGLFRENYYKEIKGFIYFVLSYKKNISGGEIKCPYVKCKNKKFHQTEVMMMHLLKKGFVEKYLKRFAHEEPCVPYKTMLERMIDSTSSSSNIHGVIYDNSNYYRSMVMDAMRMTNGYSGEGSLVYK